MNATSVPSLRDIGIVKSVRMIVLVAVLATLANGCRHSTPNPADETRPLFPAPLGAGWGFIDNRGKVAIEGRFESVQPFSEGVAAAKHEGRWGFINRSGAEVIPFRYRTVQSFRGGVAIVDTGLPDHPSGVIDQSGSWVVQPLFRSISAADGKTGSLFLGQKEAGSGFGFYDHSGNAVLGPYSLAFPFADGRARVKSNLGEWIIDSTGNFIAKQPVALEGIGFSDGLIAIRGEGKLGYMGVDGTIVLQPQYNQGDAFSEGVAAIELDGHWMFIDKSGTVVAQLPPEVVSAEPLSDGLSLVTAQIGPDTRKFGYVGKNGQWAVKPIWDDANPFHDGLAYVGIWRNEVVAYINPQGKRIWEVRNAQQ